MSDKSKNQTEEKITNELEVLKADVFPNIKDGSLLVVTVGSEKTPATKSDMERVAQTVNEIFDGVNGISVLVIPHVVNVEKLSLPALRTIQSRVVSSWSDDEPISIDLDSLGIELGGN